MPDKQRIAFNASVHTPALATVSEVHVALGVLCTASDAGALKEGQQGTECVYRLRGTLGGYKPNSGLYVLESGYKCAVCVGHTQG